MQLTAENVENLFKKCLSANGKLIEGQIVQAKLDTSLYEKDIHSLLLQLPEEFYSDKGRGWSFSNANVKKDNVEWKNSLSEWENNYVTDWENHHRMEWTKSYVTVEKLILLGISIGKAKYLKLDGDWQNLPGEMPYIIVSKDLNDEDE